MDKQRWTMRFARVAVGLTATGVALAALGLTLARYDIIPKLAGFSALLLGGLASFIALLAGLCAWLLGRRQAIPFRPALFVAMMVALLFAAFLATRPLAARGAPAIHDITTSLADPPQFQVLKLRADNLAGVGSLENWRRIHASAYPDLLPLKLDRPVAAVMDAAHRIAMANGWQIAAFDAAGGRMEATDSVSFIRFKDDVVVIAKPTADGRGSVVNVRSVSRVGGGDLGVNARRIRRFLNALSKS